MENSGIFHPKNIFYLDQRTSGLDPRFRIKENLLIARMEPRNRFQGLKFASLAGRYDNPIPTRYLAPTDFLKTPDLNAYF